MKKKLLTGLAIGVLMFGVAGVTSAATYGYADVVLDYFNSGTGTFSTPYGGTYPGGPGFPIGVSLDVVLGSDPGPYADFLSLPKDSFVTVGFTDETVINGVGNDIFIQEVGAAGEQANVFVSSDLIDYVFLGVAKDDVTTSFDLSSISFSGAVRGLKIVGLDNFGGSPGFDVANIQVLPGSIGPAPVPEPATMLLFGTGLAGLAAARRRKKKAC